MRKNLLLCRLTTRFFLIMQDHFFECLFFDNRESYKIIKEQIILRFLLHYGVAKINNITHMEQIC